MQHFDHRGAGVRYTPITNQPTPTTAAEAGDYDTHADRRDAQLRDPTNRSGF